MSAAVDTLQAKLDELNSQIVTGRREAQNYLDTGAQINERIDVLANQAEEIAAFLVQVQFDNAERAAKDQVAQGAQKD